MCPRGLKQGEICSPILFSLFNNEANGIMQNGKHGMTLSPELFQILIMLFADDVVLLSYTVIGLQQHLNILMDTAKRLSLVVNLKKSTVVAFRNGGHIAVREKWFYDGIKFEIVNQYQYLGLEYYKMLYNMHCNNKNNWASSVCFTLYKYGFGHAWEMQGVCNVIIFVRELRHRLIDCYLQE